MGFVKSAVKLGLAVKAVDLARKPENQQRIKDAARSLQSTVRTKTNRPGPGTHRG